MERLLINNAVTNEVNILPVALGGTALSNINLVADDFGFLKLSLKDVANGYAAGDANGKVVSGQLPAGFGGGAVNIIGVASVITGSVTNFTISDFDSSTTYTISATGGTVSRSGDTITYTAGAIVGAGSFTVNGKVVNLTLVTPVPNAPTITSPVNGATGVAASVTITANAFSMPSGSDTHASTDWQIATDSGFTTIVASSINDTVNKTSWTGVLPTAGIVYYIRARYKGTTYGYGVYCTTVSITAKAIFLPTTEEAKLTASDKATYDLFGSSVSISENGVYLAIGAYATDGGGNASGSTYVFTRSGTTWTQQAKLVASDAGQNHNFGTSVSLDATGTYLVIGAPGNDLTNGGAYVFTRSGTTWTQQAKIAITTNNNRIGYSVAINSDGTRIAIGAPNINIDSTISCGGIYIFYRSIIIWSQEATLSANDKSTNDQFGWSVAINSDGSYVVVGSYFKTVSYTGQGAAYVFTRSGTTWTQQAKLVASDPNSNSEYFGWSVAINSDGSYVVVGSYFLDVLGVLDVGAAYIFTRSGTTWTQQAKLLASDKTASDRLGAAVCINSDGTKVIVTSSEKYNPPYTHQGAAYIFTRSGTTWTQQAKLLASGETGSENFGCSVSITPDSRIAIIGSRQADPATISNAGAAYIFS